MTHYVTMGRLRLKSNYPSFLVYNLHTRNDGQFTGTKQEPPLTRVCQVSWIDLTHIQKPKTARGEYDF